MEGDGDAVLLYVEVTMARMMKNRRMKKMMMAMLVSLWYVEDQSMHIRGPYPVPKEA